MILNLIANKPDKFTKAYYASWLSWKAYLSSDKGASVHLNGLKLG